MWEMRIKECYRTQLIDVTGVFDENAVKRFLKKSGVENCGISYAVVSIIGPQSSGKSTLMNHLFQTNFPEMDYLNRGRTTKGIWIAKCIDIEPCTIAMDLEGLDGSERARTGVAMFEQQSTLFALAISDIILINIWCQDIGRLKASSMSLLKGVFEVMMRVIRPRKMTLLFVIRDQSKTPLEVLESELRSDMDKIWNDMVKPSHFKDTTFSEYFTMEFTSLVNYEGNAKEFKTQVAQLRGRISEYISPGGIAGAGRGSIPVSEFIASAQHIWKAIRENKDLNLPVHEAMVARVRCEQIANEMFSRLGSDKVWLELEEAAQAGPVADFGKTLGSLLDAYLSEYDEQVQFFNESARNSNRRQLESKILQSVFPAFVNISKHLHRKVLASFKLSLELSLSRREGFAVSDRIHSESSMVEFDQGCADAKIKQANWDSSKVREKLHADLKLHATCVRDAMLIELMEKYKRLLREALLGPVEWLFEFSKEDTWASIRRLLHHETERAISSFAIDVKGFELRRETYSNMCVDIRNFAKSLVEKKASESATNALSHMKNRFSSAFNYDNESIPRFWTAKQDIKTITKEARSVSLRFLSVLAAIRIDDTSDTVEQTLFSSLLYDGPVDPLVSTTWETVPPEYTLITPVECLNIWNAFLIETKDIITSANIAQAAYKHSWSPPAILDMFVNWFNEFMLLGVMAIKTTAQHLWNHFIVFLIVVLFSVCLWVLVTPWEYHNSALAEFVSKFSTIMSNVMNMLKGFFNGDQDHHQPP